MLHSWLSRELCYGYDKNSTGPRAKNLNHIRLPLKFLVLKDKTTNEYITDPNKIKPILRKRIKTFVSDPTMLDLSFSRARQADDNYSFHVFAEKITNHENFGPHVHGELRELVKDTPFDVGVGNIFADERGNAVIIDTEYKGITTGDAEQKLKLLPGASLW